MKERVNGGVLSLMHGGRASCATASGVHLVTLKALTSPHLSAFTSSFICGGHWGAAVPTQPSLSFLLNIYGSQETRSQQQLLGSRTSFNRLSSSSHNFVFLGFLLGALRGFRDFFKVLTADQDKTDLVGRQAQPQCHPVVVLRHCSSNRPFRRAVFWSVIFSNCFYVFLELQPCQK